ncbi:universal stress protein [Pseudoflavitalea sp. X16]|uniref:universal stress protein n=1 Tax=Paraflavitalea devenefica TaxID=2716334 RepID=UPI00141E06A9|nr:universal stress protein [Paraflavitalea devenefica]NII27827.1 universal stress protein [Paraflavitalea devenefica]
MKILIIATDFSSTAKNATSYAMDMAQALQAEVLLLHIYPLPVNYGDTAVPAGLVDWEKRTEDGLAGFKKQLEQRTGGQVKVNTELRMGNFLTELGTVCDRVQPYAVIMGCKGTTAAERFLFGSHAISAMKHLAWPVITVPLEAKFKAVKKIGLACDLQDPEATVPLDEINQLVTDFNASLHILNTGEQTYDPQAVFMSGWLGKKLRNVRPSFHFIEGNTDDAILSFAERNEVDLLVVLPHRHNIWDALIHRSHTKQFVLHSHIPLMALHDHEQPVNTSSKV